MAADRDRGNAVASPQFRWYVASQAVSLVGTAMGYTAIYWLTIHLAHGDAVVLSVLVAAQFLPLLLFSRRAGTMVGRHRPVRVLLAAQYALAAGSLAIGIPLLAGWMTIWYLWALSFAIGCVQAVSVPAGQLFMLDLLGMAELRRGSSLSSMIMGLAKILGPAVAGAIIAAIPAGAFVVAGVAATAGTRWALTGPGLVIAACAAVILAARWRPGPLNAMNPAE